MLTRFKNCLIFRNGVFIKDDLWIMDGKIVNPESLFFDEKRREEYDVDCNEALIVPGFIDLQINGGFGIDFTNCKDFEIEEAVNRVAKGIIQYGVTSFCPTIVSSTRETYRELLPRILKRDGNKLIGATILGSHLEGPFINHEKKGAHVECFIQSDFVFKLESVLDIYGDLSNVAIITLAPELNNALYVIQDLKSRGIIVSLGHSLSNLQQAENAVVCGASFVTHMFNAMLPFHHRDPGLVGLLGSKNIANNSVHFGIIADGIHTHPSALRIAYAANPKGLVLVTDAISALGCGEGVHTIGTQNIEIRNKQAFIENTDTLCGSIASMIDCIKNFKESVDCGLELAIEAATLHPARVLGIENKKGTLNFGADADFVILSQNLDIISTWVNGQCAYYNETF